MKVRIESPAGARKGKNSLPPFKICILLMRGGVFSVRQAINGKEPKSHVIIFTMKGKCQLSPLLTARSTLIPHLLYRFDADLIPI